MAKRDKFNILQIAKDTFVPVAPRSEADEYCLNAQAESFPSPRRGEEREEGESGGYREGGVVDYDDCFDNGEFTNEDLEVAYKRDIDRMSSTNKGGLGGGSLEKTEPYSDTSSSTGSEYWKYEEGRTHRKLKRRQIELIAIGGTIGVSLFVNIGTSLKTGGCLSLLLGFMIWCIPILEITCCCAEMVCYLPIKGAPFCVFAERFVDEAFGVMASWNFWVLECALIPFELTLFNTLIHFWTDGYSPAIPLAIELAIYFLINVAAVKWYGEAEFWLCIGKVLLAVGLMFFTFDRVSTSLF